MFYLFADDTDIYFESSDLLTIQKVVNRELRKVRKWLKVNRFAVNIEKTNSVLFHSAQHKLTDRIYLKIGRKKIKQKTHVLFLVVLFDSTLSWKYHLTDLSKKLARTDGLFYKVRHYVQKRHTASFVSCCFCSFSCLWCVYLGTYLSLPAGTHFDFTKKNGDDHNIQ